MPKRLQNTVKWATVGLILTFLIGVAANIDATLKVHHITIDENILSLINLAVAISAPALAFISSDVLAIELMATDIQRREALRRYDDESREWLDNLNRSWNSQQKHWGVKIEIEQPKQVEAVNPLNIINSHNPSQRNKPTLRLNKALEHFQIHPEDLEKPSRELESVIGISYGTISKAQRMIRNGKDEESN